LGLGGSGSVLSVLKNANFLYLFMGWNVFAYCAYQWYQAKKVKDKEKWKQMTASKYTGICIDKCSKRFLLLLPNISSVQILLRYD